MEKIVDDNIKILNNPLAYFDFIDKNLKVIAQKYNKDLMDLSHSDFAFLIHIAGIGIFREANRNLIFENEHSKNLDRNKVFKALEAFLLLCEKYGTIPTVSLFSSFIGFRTDRVIKALDQEYLFGQIDSRNGWTEKPNTQEHYIYNHNNYNNDPNNCSCSSNCNTPKDIADVYINDKVCKEDSYSIIDAEVLEDDGKGNFNPNFGDGATSETPESLINAIILNQYEALQRGALEQRNKGLSLPYVTMLNRLDTKMQGKTLEIQASKQQALPIFTND